MHEYSFSTACFIVCSWSLITGCDNRNQVPPEGAPQGPRPPLSKLTFLMTGLFLHFSWPDFIFKNVLNFSKYFFKFPPENAFFDTKSWRFSQLMLFTCTNLREPLPNQIIFWRKNFVDICSDNIIFEHTLGADILYLKKKENLASSICLLFWQKMWIGFMNLFIIF